MTFEETLAAVGPPDADAAAEARERHSSLAKPPGSLGRLEDLGAHLSAIAGRCPPPLPLPATVAVFAADHGVVASGVTPWPQEVTSAMVGAFTKGVAAVNVLARQVGARVVVVDVGVAGALPTADGLIDRKVRAGTDDLSKGPAMTVDDAIAALDAGSEIATTCVAEGARCLITGDMGIGNTTASTALISSFTQRTATAITGRGTGIDDAMFARKVHVVARAASRVAGRSPLDRLADIGGLEIAALAGFITGGAASRVPVILDGVIALAGAVVADALSEGRVRPYLIGGHRSVEPAATVALEHLGLDPLLDLGMRLGEGTGAVLALPLVQSAARILGQMATLDDLLG